MMTKKQKSIVFLSLLGLAFTAYAPVLPTYFLSDDFSLIGQVARHGFFITWGKFFRPVIVFSYLIDYKIWELNPFGFHLTNVLFHGLNGALLFLVVKQYLTLLDFFRPSLYAFLSAALFLVLPCHSESVSWIAGRTDVLATTFGLGATLCFVHLLTRGSKAIVISFFCLFAIALLSKETALVLPGVWVILVAAYLAIRREIPPRYHVLMVIGIVVGLLVYFLLRKAVIGQFIGGYETKFHINLLQVGVIKYALKYILRSVLPALPPGTGRLFLSPLSYLTSGIGIFIVGYFLCRVRKKLASPEGLLFGACVLCFLISLVPVLTIGINLFNTESERFLYLPSAFSAVASVLAVFLFFSSQRVAVVVICLLITLEMVALHMVNKRWIIAAHLAREIAQEVSRYDPDTMMVMNVPDNFRGAYVFRNGLNEAATTFLGNYKEGRYRVICVHNVSSLDDKFDLRIDSNVITLSLPAGRKVRGDVRGNGFDVIKDKEKVTLINVDVAQPKVEALISFRQGSSQPMLRTIRLKETSDRAKRELSEAPHP